MKTRERLEEERDAAFAKAKRVLRRAEERRGEGTSLTPSEKSRFDRHMDEGRAAQKKIRQGEYKGVPIVGPEADFGLPGTETETRENKMANQDVDRWIRSGHGGELRAGDQSIGVKAEGGALASTGFFPELQRVLQQFGGVRNTRARIFQTGHGRAFNLPGLDDVANQASQVSEGSTIGATTSLGFSDVQFDAFTFQAGPLTVTHEQLMDSELDIGEIVFDSLGERIARAIENDYAASTATSSTAINGVVTISTGAVSIAAGSSNLSFQNIRDLMFSVDPSYRQDGEWGVSDSALQALADIEDADGRPILQPDVREDLAGRLYGFPVHVIQGLGSIDSSSQFPIVFGDWRRGYGIRDVTEVRMQRLEERYAENRRVGFLSWFRTDGRPLFSSTVSAANRPLRSLKTT